MSSKIGLVIVHEYTTRVLRKRFIFITLLTPLIMSLTFAIPMWLTLDDSDSEERTIVVVDHSELYASAFIDEAKADTADKRSGYNYVYLNADLEQARSQYKQVEAFLLITGDLTMQGNTATLYSEKQVGNAVVADVQKRLTKYVRQQKLDSYDIEGLRQIIADVESDVNVKTVRWTEQGEKITSVDLYQLMGLLSALLIYMFIIMYGSMVMQGVVQEKSNRIMEVMISSVRPFDMMMGKIIGVALVGLTQFAIWVLLLVIAAAVGMPLLSDMLHIDALAAYDAASLQNTTMAQDLYLALTGMDFVELVVLFVVYFLGGYLLYSSLYAACGSAVDNETDTQQFSMPITIIVLFAMYAGIYAAQHPDSSFTWWCSMIPFTSPVVMLVRLPYDVAAWELILSLVVLVASFVATTWLAGKIYRVGVLMYGKKPSWKEVVRWIRY